MTKRTILIKRYVRSVHVAEISLTSIHEEQIDLADDEYEPFNTLTRKIEQVAQLLDCSEEEAQRIVLSRQ